MGPRSRMAAPPEVAYRAGPRSRLQTLNPSMNFDQAPPLPPTPAETPAPAAYRPGPRSRMENPPEPAYRAGPRSRLQILNPTLLTNPPPPPPPPEPGVSGGPGGPGGPPSQKNQNITEDDISSFMNQWLEQPPSSSQKTGVTGSNPAPEAPRAPGVPKIIDYAAPAGAPAPSNQGEPVYSSAMAKIRAKRAAKAAEQARQNQPTANQPTANYNSYENQNQTTSGFVDPFNRPLPPRPEKIRENVARGMIEREFNGRSFDNWNRVHARYWKSYMEEMFNELWVSITLIKIF